MIRTIARVLMPIYGILLIAGGVMGYRNGSQESLVAGGASGVVALLAAALAGRYPRAANLLTAVVATALAGVMGWRWEKTGHIMPAGAIAMLSGGVATLTTTAAIRE